MRVLAARFSDRRLASAVRDLLLSRLQLRPPDLDIAPLGLLGQPPAGSPESSDFTVLAGRFQDDQAPEVTDLVREAGGEIVVNVDEAWTRPRISPRPHASKRPPTTLSFIRGRWDA